MFIFRFSHYWFSSHLPYDSNTNTHTHIHILRYTHATSCFRQRWKISCLKISKTSENDAVNNAVNVGTA